MKTKAVIVLAVGLFLAVSVRAETVKVCRTTTGLGWLERTDQGDLVLHLAGSYYDMGYEHAKLLGAETELALRAGRNSLRMQIPLLPASLTIKLLHRAVAEKQAENTPPEFREEMRGLSEGSGVPLDVIETLHAITYLTSCSGAAAWGPASRDGELYFIRSNDIAVAIDPKTGESYHDQGMIVLYQPLDAMPYMIITWPGFIGASDGMNGAGIAVGNMSDPSRYETPAGLPMLFRLKQALARAKTLDEAVDWMTRKPWEGGYNFVVADAKIPAARVIEMDARTMYVGGWDGPAESNRYNYQGREYVYESKEDLLTRTNHPLSSELIANHKGKIDDRKPNNLITAQRYQDLRARLVGDYGTMDLEVMMNILRDHYAAMSYNEGPTLGATSHQLAFAPKIGDFLIAFCRGNPLRLGRREVSAFSQPYHRYNFYELLQRLPDQDQSKEQQKTSDPNH